MRHIRMILTLAAIFVVQPTFADMQGDAPDSKPCKVIAKACKDAGFSRDKSGSKGFWKDCMKPIVMGTSVQGVTIDKATADACRVDKIAKMQDELKAMQGVASGK